LASGDYTTLKGSRTKLDKMAEYKNQHIIPQVYLKQFGFKKTYTNSDVWCVSVYDIKKATWSDRVIKKFLTESYAYNLDSYEEVSKFYLEKDLNGAIEGRLPKIVSQLERGLLSENIHMAIAETTANFLCRSNNVRNWIKGWFEDDNLRDFFDMITKGAFESKHKADFVFKEYQTLPLKDRINTYMVHYMNYVAIVLRKASIEIIKGNNEFLYFTSDNPVSLMNKLGFGEIEREKMEMYFPISPFFLIKFYWSKKDKSIERKFIDANKNIYDCYHKEVVLNSAINYIISPIDKSLVEGDSSNI